MLESIANCNFPFRSSKDRDEVVQGYLFSGALVRDTTMFWSMKMSTARRIPSPMALRMFKPDSFSKGATLKIGPS